MDETAGTVDQPESQNGEVLTGKDATQCVEELTRYLGHDDFELLAMWSYEYNRRELFFSFWVDDRQKPAEDDEDPNDPYYGLWNADTKLLGVFSNLWFDRTDREQFERYLNGHRVDRYLEIGVYEGRSARWVFEHLDPNRSYLIDPYTPVRDRQQPIYDAARKRMYKNLLPWCEKPTNELNGFVHIFDNSAKVLREGNFDDGSIDLIYVDGGHKGHIVLTDLVCCWWLLATEGIMVVDDLHRRWVRSQPAVWEAWHGFEVAMSHTFEYVWHPSRQVRSVAIRKLNNG